MTQSYDLMGRVIGAVDSGGNAVFNTFNNQGLLSAQTNVYGVVQFLAYDILDRMTNRIDANGVSVASVYDNLDRLANRSYPDNGMEGWNYSFNVPGPTSYTNQLGNVVSYGYDARNRKTSEVYAGVTTNIYAYNGAGDLRSLTDGKNQATTWNYDSYGRVTNKLDAAANLLFVNGYDADGRQTSRWSAARGTTSYRYDAAANLTNVIYPTNAPIVLRYDALNRLTNMVDGIGTSAYTYDVVGQQKSEDGPWVSDTVSNSYLNRLPTTMSIVAPSGSAWTQSYGYDVSRRLTNAASPAGNFSYGYDHARQSEVILQNLPNGSYATNSYDSVARLLSTTLKNSANGILDAATYAYNLAGQRTNVTRAAGDYVSYTYDSIGQLKMAAGREAGGTTNRLQEQLGYVYDAAGNLDNRTNNALTEMFSVNNLNEISSIALGGTLTVAGTTTAPATNVTVNSVTAAIYGDATFAKDGFAVTNGINTFTAIAKDARGHVGTNSVTATLPGTNNYSYDLNGNLLSDGNRVFSYDDENQLTQVYVSNQWKSQFSYDGRMRRRIRKEFTWSGGSWTQTNETHYLYDGNLVAQERDSNNVVKVTYTRGNDLSGTLQRTGGIGGLLARTDDGTALPGSPTTAYYHADGSGNVTSLIYANQAIAAKYLYDPYGNTLAASGPLAGLNVYQFSSKEWNANAGLCYYLYRFYDPTLQRWVNRDPLGDLAVFSQVTKSLSWPEVVALTKNSLQNPFEFDNNGPTDFIDKDGLQIALPIPGGISIPVPPPAIPVIGAGVCGWMAGVWLCDNTPVGDIGKHIGDWICPQVRTKTCTYACSGGLAGAAGKIETIIVPIGNLCSPRLVTKSGAVCLRIGIGPVNN